MSESNNFFQLTAVAFRDLVATLLTDEAVPEGIRETTEFFQRLKPSLGRKKLAEKLSLTADELQAFTDCLHDVVRRNNDERSDRELVANDKIACLRLLSWLHTISQKEPAFKISSDVEAVVSEDLSRKKIRALELVIRNLIGERHRDQSGLATHLREIFGNRTVDRWSNVADQNDLLSGTTFSELASIFVNKSEFDYHQKLYQDSDVLNLLTERRKTVQCFLEDIRRIRNTLSHNKKISDIQLSLLDLYYEQLIAPIESAHQRGDTSVNPARFLEVSDQELDQYFSRLQEDVMSVKQDVAELRDALNSHFEETIQQGARIESATRATNQKLWVTLAAVGFIAIAVVGIWYLVQRASQQVDRISDRTDSLNKQSEELLKSNAEISATARSVEDTTKSIDDRTKSIDDTSKSIDATTRTIDDTTKSIKDSTESIEKNTDRIASSTEKLEAGNEQIIDSVKSIAESNSRMVQSIESIQKGFANVSKSGGIIDAPTLPQEVYHNARVYEQRSDYANARKSYLRFFDFDLELIDPHLRFQTFLKLQEGREGAREVYAALQEKSKSIATEFAAILLEKPDVRKSKMEAFSGQHPQFAPAFYELSREYSKARLGTQDIADMASEKQLLEKFLELRDQGHFVKFVLDKNLADEQISDAQERLNSLAAISDETLKNPVSLSGIMSNSGWMITIQIAGQPKEILYRIDPDAEFKSTGHMQIKNFQTGQPMPNMTVNLETNAGPTTFEVKYVDANDRERGPFSIEFEPKRELVASQKRILEMLPQSWIEFRDFDGKTLVYFSHLLSYRASIKEIWYGIDKEEPDTLYRIAMMTNTGVVEHSKEFDQGDPGRPGAILEDEMPFFSVPGTTKFMTVRIKYLDGTESEIQRFKR